MRINVYDLEMEDNLPKLVKENGFNYNYEFSTDCIFNMFNEKFGLGRKAEEHIYAVCTDTKGNRVSVFPIAKGTANECHCSPREILIRACMVGAVNLILVHNHPSGNTIESAHDVRVFKRMKTACDIVGINLIDFIIICEQAFNSFRGNGHFDNVS